MEVEIRCCGCKESKWFEGETVQIGDREWGVQPIGPLCDKCGHAIASCTDDPELVLSQALASRAKRAEIMLLGEIYSGNLPPDFKARLVEKCTAFVRRVGMLSIRCSQS